MRKGHDEEETHENGEGSHLNELSSCYTNDAPTPIITNCIPKEVPPALELNRKLCESSPSPRFSDDTSLPIMMKRPLPLLKEFRSLSISEDSRRRRHEQKEKQLLQEKLKPALDTTLYYFFSERRAELAGVNFALVMLSSLVAGASSVILKKLAYDMRHPTARMLHSTPAVAATTSPVPLLKKPLRGIFDGGGRYRYPFAVSVSGIPNYGQTCFMNSVLQALASLEPFCAYLEHVMMINSEKQKEQVQLCQELLHVLQAVNGVNVPSDHYRRGIDPRGILRRVGQKHGQFQAKSGLGREQQDAQEFLQALLGMVVEDAEINVTPSVVPCFRSLLESDLDGSDEVLTVVSGARERKQGMGYDRQQQELIGRIINGAVEGGRCVPLEASLLSVPSSPTGFLSLGSGTSDLPGSKLANGNGLSLDHSYDEKKQEEFSPHIPYVSSETNLFSHLPVHSVETIPSDVNEDLESLSDISSKERQLSAAIRRMLTTTSSITPSPLCGWMGSALQCRTCRHVRPIQNVPFLDIPIVPTNVSNYLNHCRVPSKSRPVDMRPPCTLETCLEEFTNVERVHDVECRSCTWRREMAQLEEEALMLREGIQSLLSKAKKQGMEGGEKTIHLRNELEAVQSKLEALRETSPDDEGALERILSSDNPLGEEAAKLKMHRSDAFKCLLLTRLPAILCIHVQRRFYDPETQRIIKTEQHVIFPEYLDLGPFCAYGGSLGPDASWAGTPSSRPSEAQSSIRYRLMSVIQHYGGAFSGHYVSYRRDPATGRWLCISDDTVRTVEWNTVRCCQAYMLFYEAM